MLAFLYIVTYNIILIVSQIQAAKILAVFPTPSISHQVVFRPLTQALASAGHEVIVITADPAFPNGGAPPNLTEIDVHDISYGIWRKEVMKTSRGSKDDSVEQMNTMMQAINKVIEEQFKDKQVQKLINNKEEHFDLLLAEAFIKPILAFSHMYKMPVIQVSSFGGTTENYETVGAPVHPLLYPIMTRRKLNNLTMWDKIKELYYYLQIENILRYSQLESENNLVKRIFGPDTPHVTELFNNVDMLFLNLHPVFEGIRPVPPSVVYMGGLHQKPEKELPEDLKTYLDSSKHGVIYISFGTNVEPSLLPAEKIQALITVFSKLPYDVLWKWNKDELPGRSDNIRISKWLPQSDLLRHPKIKLFVMQGGLQSTDEAITAGVPLIGMPMLGDQWFNVERYETHKIGIRLDMETLTEEKFKNAINTIIEDNSFRRNIIRLRDLMRDEPQRPLERAVWWTEHVLRHGGAAHLRSPSANITWWQYLELELVLILLAALLTAAALIIVVLNIVYKYVLRNYLGHIKIKRA